MFDWIMSIKQYWCPVTLKNRLSELSELSFTWSGSVISFHPTGGIMRDIKDIAAADLTFSHYYGSTYNFHDVNKYLIRPSLPPRCRQFWWPWRPKQNIFVKLTWAVFRRLFLDTFHEFVIHIWRTQQEIEISGRFVNFRACLKVLVSAVPAVGGATVNLVLSNQVFHLMSAVSKW